MERHGTRRPPLPDGIATERTPRIGRRCRRAAGGSIERADLPIGGKTVTVYVVHATKKLLERLRPAVLVDPETPSTTMLGGWYATVLFWRPQVALLVNEATLLPVLTPLAPAATLLDRFPAALAAVLAAHGVGDDVVASELVTMDRYLLAKTANRSILGVMNEFSRLADAFRDDEGAIDVLDLAVRLAETPCSPLYKRHVSPDRELAAWVRKSYSGTH